MRHSFGRIISGYGEVAKDKLAEGLTEEEEHRLDIELQSKIARAVRDRSSNRLSQEEIYKIQEKKQEIMRKLKERIALLDDSTYKPERRPDEKTVIQMDDGYIVKGERGRPDAAATKGDLLTDMNWDTYYYLDPATVDRNFRKRYLIEDAKHELARLLDEQITTDEIASGSTTSQVKQAYERHVFTAGVETGFIAERMVKGLLQKLTADYDVDFDVLEADIFQDITKKIDFIIRRKKRERGVGVIENTKTEQIGIQFTTNIDPEAQERKTAQVQQAREYLRRDDKIKDIVLVSMPPETIRNVYDSWRANPQPGGPDKQWGWEVKEKIFRGVMADILSPAEIDEQWNIIRGNNAQPHAAAIAA